MAKSKGSAEYRAAVAYIEQANRERAAAGLKKWSAEQKHFAVAMWLSGVRWVKQQRGEKQGTDDDEPNED